MWNIYSAFELVYTERWKHLPNLGFKKGGKTGKRTMAVKRKTHALVSLLFGLNYTAGPGKICVWIKNRLDWNTDATREHFRVSKTLGNPLLLIESSQEFIARKGRKAFLYLKIQVWLVVVFQRPWLPFQSTLICFLFVGNNRFSSLLTIFFLVSNIFCLGVGLCYLLLFVSAVINTLVARGSSRTRRGNWCLRRITFLFLICFTVSSEPRCRGM